MYPTLILLQERESCCELRTGAFAIRVNESTPGTLLSFLQGETRCRRRENYLLFGWRPADALHLRSKLKYDARICQAAISP